MVYVILNGEKIGETDSNKKMLFKDRSYPVIIEKDDVDSSSEFPFPGFSRNLIGLSQGDEEKLEYTFPEDYKFDDMSGITGAYHVKIEEVKGRKLPEINDEFAKSIGEYESVEDFRSKIKETLEERVTKEQDKKYEDQIIAKLLESGKIKYPPQMLDHEIDHFIHDLERQISSMGMNIEIYLKSRDMDMTDLREEIKPDAEDRMKRNLILSEIAVQEEISLTPEEIEEKTQQTMTEIQQYYSEVEAQKFTREDVFSRLVQWIVTDEITARTRERLRKIARGEEIKKEEETSKPLDDDTGKEISEEENLALNNNDDDKK
jgi:trigger factor